ncbi:BTB/POZ domain-containing protein 3 [Anabrus simplex]|uniref:BTB/POZ domain-containing protein 3 n=1 Tax=Anabrus simplex TaxID=316456 RepID=UPI0035A2F6A1
MEQQVSLSGSTINERSQSLLETGLGSNCIFIVGESKVYFSAIKGFLIRVSPVFERMFYGELRETEPTEVPDIEPDVFNTMLRFIYGCDWSFKSNAKAVELCYAAHKYMIHDLLQRCVEHLWPTTISDVWTALEVGNLYSLPELRDAAMKIINENSSAVLESSDILHISQDCLTDILRGNALEIPNEMDVFKMCYKWALTQCEQKGLAVDGPTLRNELGEALNHIRFLVMGSKEFVDDVITTGILTTEESLDILCFLVMEGRYCLSSKLCTSREKRIPDDGFERLPYL